MLKKTPFFVTLGVAFLVTGNLIGAGILGLPIKTGLAGLIPSLIGMLIAGGVMYFSAVILSFEAIDEKKSSFNYPSLFHNHLGFVGKWIAIVANLIVLYGLLTAYLTGGTAIITHLFDIAPYHKIVLLAFFAIITFLNLTKMSLIRKYNVFLMILLWASFAIIVFMAEPKVQPARLTYSDWLFLPAALPIMLTSFHFHNIIPHVCHSLNWNRSTILKTMLIGMIIGYVMNAIWIQVGVGTLPLVGGDTSLLYAFQNNLPSTVPLSKLMATPFFATCAMLFALLAILTSYLATGIGLLGFYEDLTKNHLKITSKSLSIALAFGPPLLISFVYPDIFLKALDVVGGIGIAVLFGILPSVLAIKRSRTWFGKTLGVLVLTLFAGFLLLEICQELGWLDIEPNIEYWKHHMGKH